MGRWRAVVIAVLVVGAYIDASVGVTQGDGRWMWYLAAFAEAGIAGALLTRSRKDAGRRA